MRRCACRLSHAHTKSERCGRMAERCGVWQVVKNEGNELFKESHFADALEKYNQAIDLNPEVPTYYCNRAFCHTKMENHGLAIEDAGARGPDRDPYPDPDPDPDPNPHPNPLPHRHHHRHPNPNPNPHPNAEVALEP